MTKLTDAERRAVVDRVAKRIKDQAIRDRDSSLSQSYERCRATAQSWIEQHERKINYKKN